MGAKGKTTIRTRSQRQVRFTQAKKDPSSSSSSSDEEDRGVTPTPPPPTNSGKTRRRPLRKRLQVLASSDGDTVSENEKTTSNGVSVESDRNNDDSDSTTDDDPVERMKEIDRLPRMIMEVRKLSEEIAMVCDALEQALTSDAADQDVELESLKKKLANLTERVSTVYI